mmetsp:Transcript_94321/g.196951  ORF Transcript_94321/g.196951 Transcript_94321/m.196951 type:complete len:208 (-) Transcript_94321:2846-3469(-)
MPLPGQGDVHHRLPHAGLPRQVLRRLVGQNGQRGAGRAQAIPVDRGARPMHGHEPGLQLHLQDVHKRRRSRPVDGGRLPFDPPLGQVQTLHDRVCPQARGNPREWPSTPPYECLPARFLHLNGLRRSRHQVLVVQRQRSVGSILVLYRRSHRRRTLRVLCHFDWRRSVHDDAQGWHLPHSRFKRCSRRDAEMQGHRGTEALLGWQVP